MQDHLKSKLKLVGGIMLVLVVVGYGLYSGKDILFGSPLVVSEIASSTTDPTTLLTGTAMHAQTLTINGRSTPIDAGGNFSESVALLPGYNVITFSATDPFGKQRTETMYTYYREAPDVALGEKEVSNN
jgi:hypothetical protein